MTQKETAALLKYLRANYPNTKISDPEAMIASWMLVLGEFDKEQVGRAVRLYMSEGTKFFPTAGEIRKRIFKADLIYGPGPLNAIEAPKTDKRKEDYYLEELCKFVGLGYEPQDDADLLCDFLDYEK